MVPLLCLLYIRLQSESFFIFSYPPINFHSFYRYRAFITQFSRSMHVELWGSGVDFLVVMPFYVVSNLYKRKSGTIIAPMPIKLIEGTLSQLGKKYIWQGHGYWFHGLLGNFGAYYPWAIERWKKMMQVCRFCFLCDILSLNVHITEHRTIDGGMMKEIARKIQRKPNNFVLKFCVRDDAFFANYLYACIIIWINRSFDWSSKSTSLFLSI